MWDSPELIHYSDNKEKVAYESGKLIGGMLLVAAVLHETKNVTNSLKNHVAMTPCWTSPSSSIKRSSLCLRIHYIISTDVSMCSFAQCRFVQARPTLRSISHNHLLCRNATPQYPAVYRYPPPRRLRHIASPIVSRWHTPPVCYRYFPRPPGRKPAPGFPR